MDFKEFHQAAWRDHADDTESVWSRLPEGLTLARDGGHVAALAGLVVHVGGEHLGRFKQSLTLMEKLLANPVLLEDDAARRSIQRSRAVLLLCAGHREAADKLVERFLDLAHPPDSSRVRVLATATTALAANKRVDEARRTWSEARERAAYGPASDDPAARSLAITGNNLAADLEEKADRTDGETELMKEAAAAARTWWEVAGDWSNVMYAEVRLGLTHLAAGEPSTALAHGERACALAEAHDAGPADRLSPTFVRGRARAATGDLEGARRSLADAEALLGRVDDQVRGWYVQPLARLRAAVS